MLDKKILEIQEYVNTFRELQTKAYEMINERKLKYAMNGFNEVIETVAEIMILEKVMDNLNQLIEFDSEGIEILSLTAMKNEVPGAAEMLNFLSLEYKDDLSDECQVIKKFINVIQYQSITDSLFDQVQRAVKN